MVRKDIRLPLFGTKLEVCDDAVVAGRFVLDTADERLHPRIIDELAENLLGPGLEVATDSLVDLVAPLKPFALGERLTDVGLLAVDLDEPEVPLVVAHDIVKCVGDLARVGAHHDIAYIAL